MTKQKLAVSSINNSMFRLLTLCLLAPAMFSLIRKAVPGQPASLEIASAILVAGCFFLSVKHLHPLPRFLTSVIGYWILVQVVYLVPSIFEAWEVGAIAIVSRIFPILMVSIAFSAIYTWQDFKNASLWIGVLVLLLTPIGIATAYLGNYAMPIVFQPTQAITLVGKSSRLGLATVSTIFSNQASASMSMLAIAYLALTNLSLAGNTKKWSAFWWAVLVAALILTLLSTRRGALIGVTVGICAFLLWTKKLPKLQIIFATALIILGINWLDTNSYLTNNYSYNRIDYALDLNFANRISDVFIPFVTYWAQRTPVGTYLGAAGPEARVMGIRIWEEYPVEVGAAQLIVETGVFGAVLFPLILLIIVLGLLQQARGLQCTPAVRILLLFNIMFFTLFYTKESSAMNNVSMAQLLFWATPGICAALIKAERAELTFIKPRNLPPITNKSQLKEVAS